MSARVCMVVKNQLWNDARVKKEASSLAGAGHRVTIVCRPEEGAPGRECRDGVSIIRVPASGGLKSRVRRVLDGASKQDGILARARRHPLKTALGGLFHSCIYQRRLLAAALGARADVYHAHDLDTLAVCWAAAKLRRAGLVYDSHELWLESARHLYETEQPFRFLERATEKLLAPRAHGVIAVTPGRARVMERMYPSMKKPLVVPNHPFPEALPERDPVIRKALGAEGDHTFLVLYQGVVSRHRGLDKLVRAVLLLGESPVRVAILGHDASGGGIRRMAEEAGVLSRLTLHPPVPSEELPRYTASADAGLILFRRDCMNHILSLPNKLFEYMMASIPVIACDLPETGEVLSAHDCGLTVDAEDPAAIARAMEELASDRERAAAAGLRGRAAALKNYTWDRAERTLLELYFRLSPAEARV